MITGGALGGNSGVSQPTILAAAAAAEILAAAARRTPYNSDYVVSARTATRNGYTNEDYLSMPGSGLDATVLASTTPLKANINGTLVTVSVDTAVTCENGLNFIYLKSDGTFSRTATAPTISRSQPAAPAANDHWYDLNGQGTMYKYNGSAWVATPEIYIGKCYATGGNLLPTYGCVPAGRMPAEIRDKCGDGSDGQLLIDGTTTNVDTEKNYTDVTVVNAGTLTHTAAILLTTPGIKCQGGFSVFDTSSVNLTGKGNAGGAVSTGAGNKGTPTAAGGSTIPLIWGGGGGGGGGGGATAGGAGSSHQLNGAVNNGSAGGGAAGNGSAGVASAVSSAMKFRGAPPRNGQGGGGGSGGGDGANGGASGAGGGYLPVCALFVCVASGASWTAKGADGTAASLGTNTGGGAGGGSAILYIYFASMFDFNGSTFLVTASSGGAGKGTGGAGAAGGAGARVLERW